MSNFVKNYLHPFKFEPLLNMFIPRVIRVIVSEFDTHEVSLHGKLGPGLSEPDARNVSGSIMQIRIVFCQFHK